LTSACRPVAPRANGGLEVGSAGLEHVAIGARPRARPSRSNLVEKHGATTVRVVHDGLDDARLDIDIGAVHRSGLVARP
jgi:hypothetical protein